MINRRKFMMGGASAVVAAGPVVAESATAPLVWKTFEFEKSDPYFIPLNRMPSISWRHVGGGAFCKAIRGERA